MKKTILACIAILLLTVVFLGFAQALLMPKYMSASREGALIAEYYEESGDHDVLFIGDCEAYESFTPATLWEEYGITSYIRGSAQQLIWQSYYLLEEMLERETPKAVVYNVYAMKYGKPQDEAYNRMTLDGMQWSSSKLGAINASMTEEEDLLSYVFPIFRFHSRWSQLSGEDFTYLFSRDRVSHNGYMMQTAIDPKPEEQRKPTVLVDYTLPEICFDYLDRMRTLCNEKGIELILIKAPTNTLKYYWYDEWEEQIDAYAEEHGVKYYNFIPLAEEIGIDWSTDTYDAGAHLNVYGAEKLTRYFGSLLVSNHGYVAEQPQKGSDLAFDAMVASYYEQKADLEAKRDQNK